MVTSVRLWTFGVVAAFSALAAVSVSADDAEGVVRLGPKPSEGVVRISDQADDAIVRGQSAQLVSHECEDCKQTCPDSNCPSCQNQTVYTCPGYSGPCAEKRAWMHMVCDHYAAQLRWKAAMLGCAIKEDCQDKHRWLRCKFGYFVPTGCGGAGCPPWGHYNMVYPVDPSYHDGRDGQVYAAQGYGGPVSVPLAPNVHHTYNYGWGIPSSRLTPVSHPTY